MDREQAKALLEQWAVCQKSEEINARVTFNKQSYLEAQACYDSARATLAGIKATFSALEIFSDNEMKDICQNALKRRRTFHGILSEHTREAKVAWKSFLLPILQSLKIFFYFLLGTGMGALFYTLFSLR